MKTTTFLKRKMTELIEVPRLPIFLRRLKLLAAMATWILVIGTAHADVLTVNGDLGFSFNASFDGDGNVTGYTNSINLADIEFNVPLYTVPIGILPIYRDGQPRYWSDPSIYDNLTLSFVNAVNVSSPIVNLAHGHVSVNANNGLINTLTNAGPTEKSISVPIPFASSAFSQETDNLVHVGAALQLKFDVHLDSGSNIIMDQPNVTLEKLTVNSGATLTANHNLRVRTDLVNHSFIGNLGGTVEGDFLNYGDASAGNRVFISGNLNLQGQLVNQGEIRVESGGQMNMNQVTSNDGVLIVEGGAFRAFAQFANFGTFELRDGSVNASSDFLNFGDYTWRGGSVSGTMINLGSLEWHGGAVDSTPGLINLSENFVVTGTGRKHIASNRVLTNEGTITHLGDSVLHFDSSRGSSTISRSTLNNLAEAVYRLEGDGQMANGNESYFNTTNEGVGHGTINNAGTFVKSAGAGVSAIGNYIIFNNSGTVRVESGKIVHQGTGTNSDGHFSFSNESKFELHNNYALEGNLTATGNGIFEVVSGNVTVGSGQAAAITGFTDGARFVITGGALSATSGGALTLNLTGPSKVEMLDGSIGGTGETVNLGNFEWRGGWVSATAAGFINRSENFEITGTERKQIASNRVLTNEGTVTHLGDSVLRFDSSSGSSIVRSTLNNLAGAIYRLEGDGQLANGNHSNFGITDGAGRGIINNAGTFVKSAGTGVSAIGSHIIFNNSGTVHIESGTLQFAGGYTQTAGSLTLNGGSVAGETLNIQGGEVNGSGTIAANLTVSGGIISPGHSPGIITIQGDYTQDGGSFLLEVGGLSAGWEYDQIVVTGDMLINDGMIELNFINGFAPSAGDVFSLFDIGGNFVNNADFSVSGLEDGWQYETNYNPDTGGFSLTSLNNGIAIPEPSIGLLLALSGVLVWLRRQKVPSSQRTKVPTFQSN